MFICWQGHFGCGDSPGWSFVVTFSCLNNLALNLCSNDSWIKWLRWMKYHIGGWRYLRDENDVSRLKICVILYLGVRGGESSVHCKYVHYQKYVLYSLSKFPTALLALNCCPRSNESTAYSGLTLLYLPPKLQFFTVARLNCTLRSDLKGTM